MGEAGNRPKGHDDVAPNRFWTSPDGTGYRVWLEQAPRHVLGRDPRPILTFVDMGQSSRQLVRRVEVGTVLEEMGDRDLQKILAPRQPSA